MTGRFTPLGSDDPQQVGEYKLRAARGGGMGRKYLAFTAGGYAVPVKVVRPEYAGDEEFRRRFRMEIAAARQVKSHLYTAPVVNVDAEAGCRGWPPPTYPDRPCARPSPNTAPFRCPQCSGYSPAWPKDSPRSTPKD